MRSIYLNVLNHIGKRYQIYCFTMILLLNVFFNINECYANGFELGIEEVKNQLNYDYAKSKGNKVWYFEFGPNVINSPGITQSNILLSNPNLNNVAAPNIFNDWNLFNTTNNFTSIGNISNVNWTSNITEDYLRIVFKTSYLYIQHNQNILNYDNPNVIIPRVLDNFMKMPASRIHLENFIYTLNYLKKNP